MGAGSRLFGCSSMGFVRTLQHFGMAITNVLSIAFLVVLTLGLINGWQAHSWSPDDGRTRAQVVPLPLKNITIADMRKLSTRDLVQLFVKSPSVPLKHLDGEFAGEVLDGSAHAYVPFGRAVFNHAFGLGPWTGQAFADRGLGFNTFTNKTRILRQRRFRFYLGKSSIDNKDAILLDYSTYNDDAFTYSRTDELRLINNEVFLGMALYRGLGNSYNPIPYVLKSPPKRRDPKAPNWERDWWILFQKHVPDLQIKEL
eukprot:c46438_g1_i1.p1 GENE.c46438_g1_i1~~c46438_g1_i1.p1  ORF type:complete len:256 (-),score=38.22 c46438_g1_i1:14-781(-)